MSEQSPKFGIEYIYVNDQSFEAPKPMHRFETWKPVPSIQFDHSFKALKDDLYEVMIHVQVEVKNEDETVFVAEVKQAGEFLVKGFKEDQKEHLLEAYCPNALLPYARQKISDTIAQGGFPPLFIGPVDFDSKLQQKKAEANK